MSGLNSLFELLERHPGRVFWCVGLAFATLYVSSHALFPREGGRIINGDAIQYYAYLRSLVVDGDLDFQNDYRLFYEPESDGSDGWATVPTTGRAANLMSVGPALLWAPLFLFVGVCSRALGGPMDGMAAPFQLSAGVAGILYGTAGLYLCYDICRQVFDAKSAFWATLTAWLATSALYYTLVSPAYSHSVSLFAVALFSHTWLRTRAREGLDRHVLLGALGGLVALVRWQDVIVLSLPLIELCLAVARRERSVVSATGRLAAMGLALLLVFIPQMVAWQVIYGEFLLTPQGGGFMNWTNPAIGSVLFSLNHGLFTWTPVVVLAMIGLRWLILRDAVVGWSALAILAQALYINAAVSDWWAGEAFGARRFIGYTAFMALGLAAFFSGRFWKARPALVRWSATGLVVYNMLFFVQYQLFMRGLDELAPYPTTAREVFLDRLAIPWRLVRYWLG